MTSKNTDERDRMANLILGKKGEGKSPYIMQLIDKTCDLRKDKVLIVSASTPKSYQGLMRISNVKSLERPWHGVFLYYDNRNEKKMLTDIKNLVMDGFMENGTIFFDDCGPYLEHNPSTEIKSFLTHHKNQGCDIYFVHHSFALFSAWCRRMVGSVTVFKTEDVFLTPRDFLALKYPAGVTLYNEWVRIQGTPPTNKFIQPHATVFTGI